MDFKTKIEPDDGDFMVNGKKFYCTGALFADYIPTAAVNTRKNGLLVIIPRQTPGLTVIEEVANWVGIGGLGPLVVGSTVQVADALEEWVGETDVDRPLWRTIGRLHAKLSASSNCNYPAKSNESALVHSYLW